MNLKEILSLHFKEYPEMRPSDAVKLIFQNEFGGGHLIRNKAESLKFLRAELEVTPSNPALSLSVPIGNGLVRINLAATLEHRIRPEALNDAFVASAAEIKGCPASFRKKLELLTEFVRELESPPFSAAELRVYLKAYEEAGYPAVSHSPEYREKYAPAYRIILKKHLTPKEY